MRKRSKKNKCGMLKEVPQKITLSQFCKNGSRDKWVTSQTIPSGVRELEYLYFHIYQSLAKG